MDERGSILIGTLFLAVMISLGLGGLVHQIDNTRQNNIRASARTHASFAQTTLQMILSQSSTCATNLTAAAFGTNIGEIQGRSSAGLTQITIPSPVPAGVPTLLTPGSTFGRFQINKISFGLPTQIFPPDLAWMADLIVEITPFGAPIVRNLVIPFYFEADGSGLLVNCFATARAPVNGVNLTVEDEICAYWFGPTHRYRYGDRFCMGGP